MLAFVLLPINIRRLWLINFGLLMLYILVSTGFPFLKGSVLEYPNVKAPAFDGTVSPITYVPNWLISGNLAKTLRYEDVAISDFIELPVYDPQTLEIEDANDKIALMARATFLTPYMGSYRMNFKEYDGSHLGVDIRAPLGTPVMAIANGIVTKAVSTENADGKYVVIRHDSVSFNGNPPASYYSSYLHLESVNVSEGTSIRKGEILGKVGMTGITTTPHLHFQIDNADAPFHSYWPYTFQDLRNLKINFFEAVNLGLGKENAMKYTVHPMEFVQKLADTSFSVSTPLVSEIKVAGRTPPVTQNFVTSVPIPLPAATKDATIDLWSAPELPGPVSAAVSISQVPSVTTSKSIADIVSSTKSIPAYEDISGRAAYVKSAMYLKSKAVPVLQNESVFRPFQAMTRREAVLYLAGVFNVEAQQGMSSPFADVPLDDAALGYITAFQAKGIITAGWLFRPNESVTKAELIAMLMRLTGDYQTGYEVYGKNGHVKKFIADTKFTRAGVQTNKAVTRADAARMIEAWGVLKGR